MTTNLPGGNGLLNGYGQETHPGKQSADRETNETRYDDRGVPGPKDG